MAKSKEQKRQEALARLEDRIAQRQAYGQSPTFDQRMERNALSRPIRKPNKSTSLIESIFGPADPITGMIYADYLPPDFTPTPELDNIVSMLRSTERPFVEVEVSLTAPEGFKYATYIGSGTYLDQWVSRECDYQLHHTKNLFGDRVTVVFCKKGNLPEYNENDVLISGVTKEMYDRSHK